MRHLLIFLAIGFFVNGCGTRGPLYLPEPASSSRQPGPLVTPPAGPERPVPADTTPAPK